MPKWPDIATWRGPTPNTSGSIADHMYVVVHTADGSFEGTIAWQRNPAADVSSHFVVGKDGAIAQMLDTNQKPWTQKAGNPYSISIENEGNENTPLTAQQIEANARILAKAHQVHGIPLQLTGHVGTRGLGHHSMGAESGVDWGHSLCPGSIIKGQKPAILARAKEIVSGVSAASTHHGGTEMMLCQVTGGDGKVWLTGPTPLWVTTPALRDKLLAALGQLSVTSLSQAEFDAVIGSQRVEPADLVIDDATRDALALAAGQAVKDAIGTSLEARLTAWANSADGQAALVAAANKAEDS